MRTSCLWLRGSHRFQRAANHTIWLEDHILIVWCPARARSRAEPTFRLSLRSQPDDSSQSAQLRENDFGNGCERFTLVRRLLWRGFPFLPPPHQIFFLPASF